MILQLILSILFIAIGIGASFKGEQTITKQRSTVYEPTWGSLDSRPLPGWFDEVKFGIFIVWGVYSVPSCGNEWFWWNFRGAKDKKIVDFMTKNYRSSWTYPEFAEQFTAEFYDPDQWASVLEASGAKYIVLTTKHHDGYTLWPSKRSFNWNSMAVGPKRDLVGELAASLRNNTDIHIGLYHSLFEWFNPIYLQDKANKFTSQKFVEEKTLPELYELVNNYKPGIIWSDGQWEANSKYWNSTEFLAWLYNESPVKDTVVTNDRWGSDTSCKHGGFFSCSDRYNPKTLQKHKWENAMTIDAKSWGYRREAPLADYLSIEELITQLAQTVSCGGNLLMNIGPTHDGRIIPIFEERLRQMGSWLKINGDAIYGTKPWAHQNDSATSDIWYTSKSNSGMLSVYAIVLTWPKGDTLTLGSVKPTDQTSVKLLGYTGDIKYKISPAGGLDIAVPVIPINKMPCEWAWVYQLHSVDSM